MSNIDVLNPLKIIMPETKCERCFDTLIWLTPQNMVEFCPNLQLGIEHSEPKKQGYSFALAARRLKSLNTWLNPMEFELGRILTHYDTLNPCSRTSLFECFFADTNLSVNQKLRKFHGLVEELRKVWLLPVGSRKESPAGYWIITDLQDFKSWVERAKSAPITQLSTIHRVAKHNFPIFAEQMELEFWNDMEETK